MPPNIAVPRYNSRQALGKLFISFSVILFVLLFSLYLPLGFSPDYLQYDYYIDFVRSVDLVDQLEYRFEPGFAILVNFLASFVVSNELLFGLMVALSTAVKLRVLSFHSSVFGFGLAVVLFFFKIFPLQEFNQIRVALSISILFLFFAELVFARRVAYLIVLAILSILFHYSAALVIPFLLVANYITNLRIVVVILLLTFISIKISGGYLVDFLGYKLAVVESYGVQGVGGVGRGLFSPAFFPEYFIICAAILFWHECPLLMRKIVIFQTMGFALFYGMSDFEVFAVRGREFFSAFWLVFVGSYWSAGRNVKLVILLFVASSVVLGLYLFIYLDFFSFYKMVEV